MSHLEPLSRRSFLLNGVRIAAALPWLGPAHALAAPTSGLPASSDRILVVLQLTGGNDGLNTVVPLEQDAYFRARPVLSQVAKGAHRVDEQLAFHPALARFAERAREGKTAVVHSVGMTPPDRSHFHSMALWHAGRLPEREQSAHSTDGWLGRAARSLEEARPGNGLALHVGRSRTPESLAWPGRAPVRLADPDDWKLVARSEPEQRIARAQAELAVHSSNPNLAYLARTATESAQLQARLEASTASSSSVDWPNTALARDLELVARLIQGGLGAPIYSVELEGFDTHLDQPKTHEHLLRRLDGALDAFLRDLEANRLDDRVCVLVFSEFGRRVAENKSAGTDHGAAGPVLLAGASLRSNQFGRAADLADLIEGDLPATTDFRVLQQSVSSGWLGVPPELKLPKLDLFQA